MDSMNQKDDAILDSLIESTEAMIRMVDMAKNKGFYDGKMAESAFMFIEAGLKLTLPLQDMLTNELTSEDKTLAQSIITNCDQMNKPKRRLFFLR